MTPDAPTIVDDETVVHIVRASINTTNTTA